MWERELLLILFPVYLDPPTQLIPVSQAAIEALLKQRIGLDPKTIGSSTIARAVNQRLRDCGVLDLTTYLKRLQTSTEELDALIENIIVPETWFFRDKKPFDFLGNYIKAEWLLFPFKGGLRVLSVPCSTGEEPYSIAIALLESGLTSKNFSIDAVDISKKSIHKAQRGVYSQNSFRGGSTTLQKRYFTQTEDGYQLGDSIKSTVKFIHGNLLDSKFFKAKKQYHIIFCRNLLIYLDKTSRQQAIQLFDDLLINNGLLFVGSSEMGQILPPNFVPVRHPTTFAFRKGSDRQSLGISRDSSVKTSCPPRAFANDSLQKAQQPLPNPLPPSEGVRGSNSSSASDLNPNRDTNREISTPNSPKILEVARVLADRGQLNEAASLCETYLSENPVSADAYFLVGQIHQAMKHEELAEQCFHKAIYLEPQHYEALLHLALLKEYHGDHKSATLLRQRIQRQIS